MHQIAQIEVLNCKSSLPWERGHPLPHPPPLDLYSKYIEKCNFSMHQIAQFEV